MSFESLFDTNPEYYEYAPGYWLQGKYSAETSFGRFNRETVDQARNAELRDTDVICVSYPKAGNTKLIAIQIILYLSTNWGFSTLKKTSHCIKSIYLCNIVQIPKGNFTLNQQTKILSNCCKAY